MTTTNEAGCELREILPVQLQHHQWSGIRVTGLAVDSRNINAGDCFIAYPGHQIDGRTFIADALARGAVAVLAEADGLQVDAGLPVIPVPHLKQHLGDIASAFYGNPSRQLQLVAVTGTNGKTTVTQLIAQALVRMGRVAGVMGTLGNGLAGALETTRNTTPDIVATNRLLRDMRDQHASVVAMEASSHGLVQGRLDGLFVHTAIVTNLSRDHLDYHGSMEAYRDAKALLVRHPSLQCLVLNADDAAVASMAKEAVSSARQITFSLEPKSGATLKAVRLNFSAAGMDIDMRMDAEQAQLKSPLVGAFNASNLLAAAAGLVALGFSLQESCRALEQVRPVAGRMQRVSAGSDEHEPVVIVDFAHTPDALEKVLTAVRRHCSGRLWCVFGCGGDRDAGKRPLMGEAVARFADEMVITSDNPRSEMPGKILADIVKGIPAGHGFQVIEDRTQAVSFAVMNAAPGDIVVLAGKGHEDYQEIQGVRHAYSDVSAAREALNKRSKAQHQIGQG